MSAGQPAPLARRFGALLVDWLLCLLVSGLFANPYRQGWAPVLVLIVEYTIFVGFFASTPGMRLLGLQCIRYQEGGVLGAPRAFVRAVLLALFIPPLIMDAERRGLHDRAARSIVISTR